MFELNEVVSWFYEFNTYSGYREHELTTFTVAPTAILQFKTKTLTEFKTLGIERFKTKMLYNMPRFLLFEDTPSVLHIRTSLSYEMIYDSI